MVVTDRYHATAKQMPPDQVAYSQVTQFKLRLSKNGETRTWYGTESRLGLVTAECAGFFSCLFQFEIVHYFHYFPAVIFLLLELTIYGVGGDNLGQT